MSDGSAFHTRGAATEKALSPTYSQVRWTAKLSRVLDVNN